MLGIGRSQRAEDKVLFVVGLPAGIGGQDDGAVSVTKVALGGRGKEPGEVIEKRHVVGLTLQGMLVIRGVLARWPRFK